MRKSDIVGGLEPDIEVRPHISHKECLIEFISSSSTSDLISDCNATIVYHGMNTGSEPRLNGRCAN